MTHHNSILKHDLLRKFDFSKNQPVKIELEEIEKLENGSKWYEKLSLET